MHCILNQRGRGSGCIRNRLYSELRLFILTTPRLSSTIYEILLQNFILTLENISSEVKLMNGLLEIWIVLPLWEYKTKIYVH